VSRAGPEPDEDLAGRQPGQIQHVLARVVDQPLGGSGIPLTVTDVGLATV
jgi:hypothetical protein